MLFLLSWSGDIILAFEYYDDLSTMNTSLYNGHFDSVYDVIECNESKRYNEGVLIVSLSSRRCGRNLLEFMIL